MRVHRFPIRLLFASLAASPLVGCEMLHSNVPVAVTVIDAETKAPVPGAEVVLVYPVDDSGAHNRDIAAITAAGGVAQLKTPSSEALPQLKLVAPGYLPEQRGLPGDAIRGIKTAESSWPFSHIEPVAFFVEVYHGPEPSVDLTVPLGFKGQVKVEVRVREDVVYQPMQRTFSATVPTDGKVQVDGPLILKHGRGPVFFAHFADEAHTLIPGEDAPDNAIAFRWLRSEGRTEVFVVGTRAEYESYRRALNKPAGGGDSSGDKKGKGRRGGGGGGDGSGS